MNIALISGASRGIGFEISKILDSYKLDELWLICGVHLPVYEYRTKTKIFKFDLSSNEYMKELENALSQEKPNIRYLVMSAGVGYNGNLESLSSDEITKTLSINCTALTNIVRLCMQYLKEDSRIINIASGSAFIPQPGFSVYAASKSYVLSLSRALSKELKPKKIYVTASCPGPVDTDFFSSLKDVKEYKKKYLISPEKVAKGTMKASKKKKAVFTPTFSMKLVHLISKIIPTSILLKFSK